MTTVLLVDDDETNRDMLGRRLRRYGFTITYASDGQSAVRKAGAERPDLILMDISLGEMDGWEATRLIRNNARSAEIPVIALTARAHLRDRIKSLEVGCTDYDTQPVDLARLLEKIRNCLRKPAPPGAERHR